MSHRFKVALLIETSRAYGRGLLEGIARYTQENPGWSLYFEPSGLGRRPPAWLANWSGDGIIARISDLATARILLEKEIPTVDLRGLLPELSIPFVGLDNQTVANLAFQHFRERGFDSFGLVSAPKGYHPHLDQRCNYFLQRVHEKGLNCHSFRGTRFGNPRISWEAQQKRLGSWLERIPRKTAVLATDDLTARETIDAARRVGLRVPEHIAVLGVDNDLHLCSLSTPPISSIAVDSPKIGYKSASMLQRMMIDPDARMPRETILPCHEVKTRASTDIMAVSDTIVSNALEFIREHACDPISVNDVVERTPVCRSLLDRRFRNAIGASVHGEILRVRLERAQQLIRESDRTMDDIAEACGFQSGAYLSQVFRREYNATPRSYRKSSSR